MRKEKEQEKTRRKKRKLERLRCKTAVLGGDAVARAKVESRRWWKWRRRRADRGYETVFLKMRVGGALVAPRSGGRGEVDCDDCEKKRPSGGVARNSPGLRARE